MTLPSEVEAKIEEMVGESTSVEMAEDYDSGAREMADWLMEEVYGYCGGGTASVQCERPMPSITRAQYLHDRSKR